VEIFGHLKLGAALFIGSIGFVTDMKGGDGATQGGFFLKGGKS
jgi:hypothetical protein